MLASLSRAALAGVVLAGLVGCSTPAQTEPEPSVAAEDVAVELMQYRRDEVNRMLVVKVGNPTRHTLRVQGMEVVAPGFAGAETLDVSVTLPPARQFDLRVPLGKPVCEGTDPDGEVVVVLGDPESGEERRVAAPPGHALLGRIRADECSVAQALDAAPVHWARDWQPVGAGDTVAVRGTLLVGPVRRGAEVHVAGVDGSVLFGIGAPALPAMVYTGELGRIDVRFRPARCDPHAMADNSRGYRFTARLRPPGGSAEGTDDVLVPVLPDRRGEDVLTEMWLEDCGFGDR